MRLLTKYVFLLMMTTMIPLVSHANFTIEAEGANQIVAPFKIFANTTASGGKVVIKPKAASGRGTLVFRLNVPETRNYSLKARVYAQNLRSNSVLVQLEDGPKIVWELPVSDSWQVVTFPQELKLHAGRRVLKILSHESDVGVDRIELAVKAGEPVPPSPTPVSTPSPTPSPTPVAESDETRGLWVWTAAEVLGSPAESDRLIAESVKAKITDVYLFLVADDYVTKASDLRRFIARLKAAGIRAWGLEGYRGYFSDSFGPGGLYKAVDQMISYNASSAPNERFYGFHSDMEPQDGQGTEFPSTFHNGFSDSQLNRTSGGVWYQSQAEDREMLMRDWLAIHSTIKAKLAAKALKFAASMPSWTDDFYGEEVAVTYNGVRLGVMKHMMTILDEYAVMSYNTDPANAANRVAGELRYADTLPDDRRPRVFAGVETHRGPGAGVSYGDHATKNSKAAVLTDLEKIHVILDQFKSFGGTNIHDWEGWRDLRP